MVKAYFKYEWYSIRRWLVPAGLMVFLLAVLGRLTLIPDVGEGGYELLDMIVEMSRAFTILFFFLALAAFYILAEVMTVIRFYKNMLSKEGYLTMSIPLSVTKQLFIKMVTAALSLFTVLLIDLLAVTVYWIGTDEMNQVLAIGKTIWMAFQDSGQLAAGIVALVEGFVLLLVFCCFTPMVFFTCMSIGQRMTNHRILGSVLCYVAWSVLVNIAGTAFQIISLILVSTLDFSFLETIDFGLFLCVSLGVIWILVAGLTAVFFGISNRILSKHLNLE